MNVLRTPSLPILPAISILSFYKFHFVYQYHKVILHGSSHTDKPHGHTCGMLELFGRPDEGTLSAAEQHRRLERWGHTDGYH